VSVDRDRLRHVVKSRLTAESASDIAAWPRIEALLAEALELPAEARDAFLDAACAGDPVLRSHISALAAASAEPGPLDAPAASLSGWLQELARVADAPQLQPGTRLGPYVVSAPLGAGGMGHVYRARDTRLDRDVAVKIVAPHLQQDDGSRKRLEREARIVASLSHPNILAVYDIGDHDGRLYIVTELLKGETLRERLAAGPVAEPAIVDMATQVARGLSAAHARQIVHRDLKPENLFVTEEGVVKILDFGLAKPHVPAPSRQTDALTSPHAVLGTIGYMSPEQLTADHVDGRSDLFALGAVLYEAVTGVAAFGGSSRSEIAAAILSSPPPASFPASISPALAHTIGRCLAKSPGDRYQSAADLAFTLQLLAAGAGARRNTATDVAPSSRRQQVLWTALAGAVLVAAGVITGLYVRGPAAIVAGPPMTFVLHAPRGTEFGRVTMEPYPAVSPDGRRLVFSATSASQRTLWIQTLGETAATQLAPLDSAGFPFWSPDGEFVGFTRGERLYKVAASGNRAPQELCGCLALGGSWNRDGVIVLGGDAGLARVSSQGGPVTPVTRIDATRGEFSHRFPIFLPDGRRFLYVVVSTDEQQRGVYLGDLADPRLKRRILGEDSNVAYDIGSDGRTYLYFVRDRVLLGQPFDVTRAELLSDPIVVARPVIPGEAGRFAAFSISGGSLVHRLRSRLRRPLYWVSRSGVREGNVGPSDASYRYPSLSPDGSKLAAAIDDPETAKPDVWVIDLVRQTSERLTRDPIGAFFPVWLPDGQRVVFASARDRLWAIYAQSVAEAGVSALVDGRAPGAKYPTDTTRDGRFILANGQQGLWLQPLAGIAEPRQLVNGTQGRLSPDGRWLAYVGSETGEPEVYVTTFPTPTTRWRISTAGGQDPQWRRDGRELFYIDRGNTLTAVRIGTARPFEFGKPQPLFRVLPSSVDEGQFGPVYAPAPDGQRFIVSLNPSGSAAAVDEGLLQVTVNWTTPPRR
jgi:Tol biopolymer transport system component/tRNA A-37 threonylcarbamoyl transferase component Bud32